MEVFDQKFIENTREQFNAVKKETINRISYIVGKYGEHDLLYISDFCEGYSPVMSYGYDDNDTFTLDSIQKVGKKLVFSFSSCSSNMDFNEDNLDTDTLLNILEFLIENEEGLKELVEEE